MFRLFFPLKGKGFKYIFSILLVPIFFLVISLFTLQDYGINWDEPKHLIRGHAYLHYILTGNRDFCDFPVAHQFKGAPDNINYNVNPPVCENRPEPDASVRRSYFQSDFYTLDYYFSKEEKVPLESKHSHPEVNGLLAAASNYIFFQKLGLVGDMEAHHLFIVLSVFALILVVAIWTWSQYGMLASIVASFSLASYPLVFSESHFNVKDPVLMSFFGLSLLAFWYGFSKKKYLWILLSAFFAGFALGTKFNTFFLPVILAPWVIFVLINRKDKHDLLNLIGGAKMLLSLLIFPFIALGILFAFSPYLWANPVGHFLEIVKYYQEVGRGTPSEVSEYIINGWNTYPLVWIIYTTPLPILFLSIIGFGYSAFLVIKKKNDTALLVLLWFLIPIIRAIFPGMIIFGGVRHIMEYVPAMAILSGIGAFFIVSKVRHTFVVLFIIASLAFSGWEMTRIHPNQNVYFNQLIGGLSGANKKNLPYWGNSYGNVYLQGINWLNENAETNARLALATNYISALPRYKLRPDISMDNAYWSGSRHEGEYVMEMDFDSSLKQRYKHAYFEKFLNPVYEVKVDGVPLLKIWKNDKGFLKNATISEKKTEPLSEQVDVIPSNGNKRLKIVFENEVSITRLVIDHSSDSCQLQNGAGYIITSLDGQNFSREHDLLIDPESPYITPEMDENTFVFMFPSRAVRTILLETELPNPCILKDSEISIWVND